MKGRRAFSTINQWFSAAVFAMLLWTGGALAQRGYARSDGINSVVYADYVGTIIEFYLDGDGWHAGDLSWLAGAPAAWSQPAA